MPTAYQITDQKALYFVTFQVVDWIDAFSRQVYRDIFIEVVRFYQASRGLQVFAYVIMTNHVHMIISCPHGDLSGIIRDLKKNTSRKIIKVLQSNFESRKDWMLEVFRNWAASHSRNKNFQFWTHENHAVLLYSNKFIQQKLSYIHNNPVKAGLVENPEDYLYSSARNYAGLTGYIDVELLSVPWKTL